MTIDLIISRNGKTMKQVLKIDDKVVLTIDDINNTDINCTDLIKYLMMGYELGKKNEPLIIIPENDN